MNHIAKISFCGLRRLNQFRSSSANSFRDWLDTREWYEFSTVNVFIGANGSGKSTVLELLDVLRLPERLVTLPRENQTANSLTAFDLVFTNGCRLIGTAAPNRISAAPNASDIDGTTSGLDIQCIELLALKDGAAFFKFRANLSKIRLAEDTRAAMVEAFATFGLNVLYWLPGEDLSIDSLVNELNFARVHLCGVLSESEWMDDFPAPEAKDFERSAPWRKLGDGRLAVYLSDDSRQQNHVAVQALPTGWIQLTSILVWLKNIPEGSVCLIEEPEAYLHPHLQRYLAQQMGLIATNRALQLFISTHSPVFQQLNVWPHGANLFEASPEKLSQLNSAWRVLDALGIRGSDIFQSNGVIWVEGPSDRLYIKHWLSLYCQANGLSEPLENVQYSFSFYGGASLAHFSIDDAQSFIDMIGINRNLAIVIDRDKDFSPDSSGRLVAVSSASPKSRILGALEAFGSGRSYAWITDEYTIESYLPSAFRDQHFFTEDGRLTLRPHHRKVVVAMQYVKTHQALDGCTDANAALFGHIKNLIKVINEWNR